MKMDSGRTILGAILIPLLIFGLITANSPGDWHYWLASIIIAWIEWIYYAFHNNAENLSYMPFSVCLQSVITIIMSCIWIAVLIIGF